LCGLPGDTQSRILECGVGFERHPFRDVVHSFDLFVEASRMPHTTSFFLKASLAGLMVVAIAEAPAASA
jgi:hypothetical protein